MSLALKSGAGFPMSAAANATVAAQASVNNVNVRFIICICLTVIQMEQHGFLFKEIF
jgi:hypothetical protein